MTTVESQLLEYRARKARERFRKEISDCDAGQPNHASTRSRKANLEDKNSLSVFRSMRLFSIFQRGSNVYDAKNEQMLMEQHSEVSISGSEKINANISDFTLQEPDNDDDKLLSRNCLVACSSTSSAKQRIIAALSIIFKVILWTVLWGLFIEIGFGAVYFVISLLIIMYYSMHTRPRKKGELSAYSVFNPGQEKLDGTFTAEQFEKELRYGAGAVH